MSTMRENLAPGAVGTVYFDLPGAHFDYHHDAEKTATTAHPDHPTWRTLGDIGRLDEEGYLYLTDRKAFMIVAGGVNIYPQEIEDVLLAHPEVLDAAVFGVPNAEMGEEVKAVIQPLDTQSAGEALTERLGAWCETRLAGFKRPRTYDYVEQLPRLEPVGRHGPAHSGVERRHDDPVHELLEPRVLPDERLHVLRHEIRSEPRPADRVHPSRPEPVSAGRPREQKGMMAVLRSAGFWRIHVLG